jgi:fructose transport system permease protein
MATPLAATEGSDAVSSFTAQAGLLARIRQALQRYPVISPAVVLILSGIAFSYFSEGKFSKMSTLGIVLQQIAVLGTVAIGQTLVILTAGVDLAVGTGVLFTHIVVAKMFADNGVPMPLALLLGLAAGMLLGAFHGFLVTKVGLPPFITTLGTFYIFQSLALTYSQAQTISGNDLGDDPATRGPDGLLLFMGRNLTLIGNRQTGFNITVGVVAMFVMYGIFMFVLANTAWGSHLYSAGNDPEAARLAGINVTRVLISVYMVAGAIYAFAGWIQIGRSGSVSQTGVDPLLNLRSVTAVVIGGTSLFGGRGRLVGTLIGALVVGSFELGLKLVGVNIYWQGFAIGALILSAVSLDQWIRRAAK